MVLVARGERERLQEVAQAVEGVAAILDASSPQDGLWQLRLQVESDETVEAVFSAFAEAHLPLRELRREQTSLEDVFTNLTMKEHEGDSSAPEEAAEAAS